jgi:hypothetical protein
MMRAACRNIKDVTKVQSLASNEVLRPKEYKLLLEEKQKLKFVSGSTTSFVIPFLYKPNYPINITGEMTIRGHPGILKSSGNAATFRVFDLHYSKLPP